MSDAKHTPGPWRIVNKMGRPHYLAVSGRGANVYEIRAAIRLDDHNAARIVACVNACEGLNPEAVSNMLAALEDVLTVHDTTTDEGDYEPRYITAARAAVTKARGGR